MKVLVVVDMQNDFIDGALGTPEAREIVSLVAETIEQLADKDTVILMTKDTHEENYMDTLEGKKLPVPHCIKGTQGHYIVDEVCIAYGNVLDKTQKLSDVTLQIIEKPTFGSIDFQNILLSIHEEKPITEITLMGVCTGICVMSNAILAKATIPEAEVNVVEDCCACVTPESHKTAIEAMKLCQINII